VLITYIQYNDPILKEGMINSLMTINSNNGRDSYTFDLCNCSLLAMMAKITLLSK